ncbi:MAG TPA: ABC transporter substrate-binding protein [Casimicrobiaceae bacterium]|nr:ABC transporter substrate-binding protein [Casimicrobiaceae bacterium]
MRIARWLAAASLLLVSFAAAAADSSKVLHVALSIAETSFDPILGWDAASESVIEEISETMLGYEYLARPVKLAPLTLERLPEVSDNGATYVCHLRKGIFFASDPAFKGKPRELVAADYAYSLKRLLDPALKSPWTWILEGKLVGGDEFQAVAKKGGRLDYDAPLPGLQVVDRYTLRIRLTRPDYTFAYVLAMPATAAVAREVVEAFGNDFGAHPVGTGPYLLKEYKRSSRIVLEANPGFRKLIFDEPVPSNREDAAIARSLRGRQIPAIGRIEVSVIEEGQPRWLAFLRGELDYLQPFPIDFIDELLVDGKLRPELAAKGIRHELLLRPNTWWAYFNMEDPVVGGYTPEKIALRRAIGMAFNTDEFIKVLFHGRAIPAYGPIPPDIAGYDPGHKTQAQVYDPAAARALLDRFGYKDRDGDGYRELPDGKPLTIEYWSRPTSAQRQIDELWKKNMDAIGIRMAFKKDQTPELRKMARAGKIQMRQDGWNADYPDADNYMQLLYGPYIGQANDSRFNLPEFNQLYEQSRRLPDSPERTKLFDRMTDLEIAYAPWKLTHHLLEDHALHDWVIGYKPHPIMSDIWKYLDIDAAKRPR